MDFVCLACENSLKLTRCSCRTSPMLEHHHHAQRVMALFIPYAVASSSEYTRPPTIDASSRFTSQMRL